MRATILVWFLVPVLLTAQEFRGTLLGQITDPSGAAVAGAAIEIVHEETGVPGRTVSNEAGNYQLPFLLPGSYTVTVERAGFRKAVRRGVRVSLNSQMRLDFALELGTLAEAVTVTASPPLLTVSGADLGQVIGNNYLNLLAVTLTRNVVAAARLAPGVTGKTGTYSSNDQAEFSIAGSGSTQARNEFLLDGIPNTVPQGGGNLVFVPPIDSVEEVKVHTTMFDASYGHSNGGALSITTRGGSNEFHGTLYLFKRWRALDANSWTNNQLGLPKPPVNYHQWGFTAGGPFRRNRTFFFGAVERDDIHNAISRQSRVPTEAERNGDFSQTLNRLGGSDFGIFDPATTVVSANRATRQAFPGARIPAARLSPIGTAVLRAYPLPNQPGPAQIGRFNWASTSVSSTTNHSWTGRADHAFGPRHRLFGRASRLDRNQGAIPLILGAVDFPIAGTDAIGRILRDFTSVAVDDTLVLSPSFVGSIRYGLARRVQNSTRGGAGLDAATFAVPDVISRNQAFAGYPVFRLGENLATLGSFLNIEATYQNALLATFTKLAGRHSLKFGADYRLARWNRRSPGNAGPGEFLFNPVFTQQDPFTNTSADRSGSAMASLLLGAPASGSLGATSPLSVQNHYLALFVQEDWKLTSRLTLNFGLRYELETPYTERYNRVGYGFDSTASLPLRVSGFELRGGLLFAGVDGRPRRIGPIDANNFGPRFGFAYSLSPRTVARGGYGLFYASQTYNTGFLGEVGSFSALTQMVSTLDNGATISTTLSNPFPNGLRAAPGAAAGLLAQVGDSLAYLDSLRVSPYNQQWHFSVQRELPSQIVVDVAYLGMLSLKQLESFDLNEKPDRFLAQGAAENTRVPNPFLGVLPATSTLGTGATIVQRRLWVAFPQFTSLTVQGANTGRAIYHALQLKAEKRFTRGFSALWSLTRSKLIDNNTTSIVNVRKYRSVSQFDEPTAMRLAFTYEPPWRTGGWRGRLVEGWSIGGFASVATGVPLSITHANGRPLRIRNPKLDAPVGERLNRYFDTGAFAPLASQYIISPEPPYLDELRAPTNRSLNLTLTKTIPLRERVRLQVRIDAIGVTNSPIFDPPGTNLSNTATFGVINGASGSRQLLGSARILF